jgi:hypothetical protein
LSARTGGAALLGRVAGCDCGVSLDSGAGRTAGNVGGPSTPAGADRSTGPGLSRRKGLARASFALGFCRD